jgi:adhesin/invasin
MALDAGNNQTATVNTTVAVAPRVIVRDQFGNPRSGAAVTFSVTAGDGAVTGAAATSDANGRAAVGSWRLGTVAGTGNNTLQATAALSGSPVTFTASATAGPATQMALNGGNNQTATVNTAVPVAPSVLLRDQFDNPVPGHPVTFTVTGGGGSVSGGNATSGANGVAAVGSWTLGTGAGANALQASASGLAGSPVTFAATGTPGPPSGSMSSIATTSPIVACASGCSTGGGTQAAITITVRDGFANPISGASVTWSATGSANTVTATSDTTDASGVFGDGRLSSTVAQTKTISATINGTVAITPNGTVVVDAGPVSLANSSIAATSPITASSGSSPSTVTVTVRDQFGNGVSGHAVTIAVSPVTGNSVTQPASATNASGVTTGSFSTTRAETKTVTASVTGVGAIPGNASVTVNPAAAASVVVNGGDGQTARVGTVVAVDPSALVRDAFLNPVPGATVTFSPTAGGGSVTGGTQTTNASGIATVTSWTLGGTSADAADGTMANTLSAATPGATSATFTASAIYTWSGDANAVVGTTSGCAGCHGFNRNPNNIVGVASSATGSCPGRTLVIAGNAASSLVYQKINWPAPCGGDMPTAPSPQLSAAQLKIVRAWINNGALNN